MGSLTRIAVDAMGGDLAPGEIVKGAQLAVRDEPVEVLLIGDEKKIAPYLTLPSSSITIEHTDEWIDMDEPPSQALKRKKKASVILACQAVREKRAGGGISAGNTGAMMEAALLNLGRIRGIRRPAIATIWPTRSGQSILLDSGANPECKAEYLVQFAHMGSLYAQKVLGVESPRVALLNIGKEEGKGNQLLQEATQQLLESSLSFQGNIEPSGFLEGEADVVVCDGFIGNLVLKTGEGIAEYIFALLREEIGRTFLSSAAAALLRPSFRKIKKMLDYSEYGGAPFLGVRGVWIKSHGRANAKAIKNAISVARKTAESGIIETVTEWSEKLASRDSVSQSL